MGHALALNARTHANFWAGIRARYLLFAGAALIGIVHVVTAFEGAMPFRISIGTIELYLFDLLTLALGGIGAILMLRRRQFTANDILFILIMALSLVQFIRGSASFGTQAGIEFRQDAFVLGGLFFFMGTSSHYTHTRRDFITIITVYAGAGILIYAARSLGFASLSQFDLAYNISSWRGQRFVGADEALGAFYMAVACFSLAIFDRQSGNTPYRGTASTKFWVYGFLALTVAFVAMHRSVWSVIAVATPVFFYLQIRHRLLDRREYEIVFVGAFILFFLLFIAILTSPTLQFAITEVSDRGSTLNWRAEGWQSLIALMNPADYLVGRGYGADYTRWILGQFVDNSAHSFYVGKLWQHGIVGLLLYLIFYCRVFIALSRIAKNPATLEDRALATLMTSLLIGELVFFIVYANWIPSVMVLGYSLGFVRSKETRSREISRPIIPPRRREAY